MTKGHFIGIGGKKESGKTTVANYYQFEFKFQEMGFSDPLNDVLTVLNPFVMIQASGHDMLRYAEVVGSRGFTKAKEIPEVRRLLQYIGTEVGRQMFHEDFWVDIVAERVSRLTDEGHNVALTGVRYKNEIDMVRRLGGSTLYITRPGISEISEHASENSLTADDFEHVIDNDKGIAELENKAGELYMDLFG